MSKRMRGDLNLHEQILLLVLRDEEGTLAPGTMYQYAIAGAMVAELLLQDRIRIETHKKKSMIEVASRERLGDELLDEALERMATAKRRATMQTWVSRLAGTKKLHHRVAQQLCRRGVLRAAEGKVLLLFTRQVYPEVDPRPEQKLLVRLREAIFGDAAQIEPRTAVLLSLAHGAQLLPVVFDKRELKRRKDRLEQITRGDLTGQATREAIEAMQAAVMVAVLIPAITSSVHS
jgi:hypothetical protein